MANKVFLLDAMALVFRAYYALIRNPRLTQKAEIPMHSLDLPTRWLN